MALGSSRHPVRRPVQALRHSPSEERRMHGRNLDLKPYKIAILWRGDAEARQAATPQNNRFYRIFEELGTVGIHAEPSVYDEEFADEVREQLLAADGVLVWVDPIHQGKTRAALDPFLRDVASRGPWVSAHPDVILKMGVKEVLYRTKHLGWGSDTHLYRSSAEFGAAFPRRLQSSGARVIKQNRGNGGQGVWKVEQMPTHTGAADTVRILHAQRGSIPQDLPLQEFMALCEPYFAWGRSEEHTSELQSPCNLVCRLLLEKKKKKIKNFFLKKKKKKKKKTTIK